MLSAKNEKDCALDWTSEECVLLLSPRLLSEDKERLEKLYSECKGRSQIWIASSGTSKNKTDSVKLIALSKKAILTAAQSANHFLATQPKEVWLNVLPIFHIGGLSVYARAYLGQQKLVDLSHQKWDVLNFYQTLIVKNIHLTSLVPTHIFDIVQNQLKAPSNLRVALVGGGKLSDDLYFKARVLGWPLLPCFGMTETSAFFACAELDKLEINDPSMRCLPHCEVATNEQGLLKIKSQALCDGYAQWLGDELKWNSVDQQNWYQARDYVEINEYENKKYIKIIGRESGYFKVNGEGVQLLQLTGTLERILLENYPNQFQDIAIGVEPNERSENQVILYHQKNIDDSTVKKVSNLFNEQVMPYERITSIKKIEKIPRNDLGKIIWASQS